MSAKYKVFDIAGYFLWKAQNGCQELLSNMKLQKLVYYAQGLHLALYDTPLFNKKIEAWTYVPVVAELQHAYEQHETRGIPANPDFDPLSIAEKNDDTGCSEMPDWVQHTPDTPILHSCIQLLLQQYFIL